MIVADLALPAAQAHLCGDGLRLRTGPVVVNIRSSLPVVQRGVLLHYAQHAVEPGGGFVDFHVSVDRPRSVGLMAGGSAAFCFDGDAPLVRRPVGEAFDLLEQGLNWCVAKHCHQYLIVRAAVLERGGRALLLPAPAGAGKSTLCAALAFGGGWRLLSDELALIDMASSMVMPLPRPLRLKDRSIELVRGLGSGAVFSEAVQESPSSLIVHVSPPAESVRRAGDAALPAWVVLPRYLADAGAQLEALSRARGFMALVENAFNYDVHGRTGFTAFAALIDRSTCHSLSYGSLQQAVTLLDTLAGPV